MKNVHIAAGTTVMRLLSACRMQPRWYRTRRPDRAALPLMAGCRPPGSRSPLTPYRTAACRGPESGTGR